MRAFQWVSLTLLAGAIAVFARYLLERQESGALRAEIALLQHENRQLGELRATRDALIARKVSDSELERLRNDRAALGRLRAEINRLEESADRKARALNEPSVDAMPALVLNLGIANDGTLLIDGAPANEDALRQLLTGFARRSERVDLRMRVDANENRMELVKSTMEDVARLGRELRLAMTLRLEKRGQTEANH